MQGKLLLIVGPWDTIAEASWPMTRTLLRPSMSDDRDLARAIFDASASTGLPAADPIREGEHGADRLARALIEARHAEPGDR